MPPDFEPQQPTNPAVPTAAAAATSAGRRTALRGLSYADGAAALSPQAKEMKPPSFAEIAAGHARAMDDTQSQQIRDSGEGDYTGSQSGEKGKKITSCIGYVLDVLKMTFASLGKSADWDRIRKTAYKQSGSSGIKGTELMKVLQSELGWVGVYWSPDTKSGDPENDYSAHIAKRRGTYYGMAVDKDKLVTDFAPGNGRTKETEQIDRLRRVKFGVLATTGGSHMTMILSGRVFEVHWSHTSDSHDLFENSGDLESWGSGRSGSIVMPPEEAAKWNDPLPTKQGSTD